MNNFITYLIALVSFLVIDGIWLSFVAKNFYQSKLSELLAPKVDWLAAGLFYPFYVFTLVYLVILPGVKSGNIKELVTRAVIFGLATYATYDLTNQATLKNWPWSVTVADIIWGAFLCTAVSLITYFIASK